MAKNVPTYMKVLSIWNSNFEYILYIYLWIVEMKKMTILLDSEIESDLKKTHSCIEESSYITFTNYYVII